ncbi:MAG TPA: hypothetical protein VM510_05430 [Caulifigura sp.]|nr:hypothetical protein [Caulifigura sp.]
MTIQLPNDRDIQGQATAAGYSTVDEYVVALLDRDAERAAIQEGIDAMHRGDMRPFEEVEAEIRSEFGFPPRA